MSNFVTQVISAAVARVARKVKVYMFGPGDVKEVTEASPFGIDSCPIPGMKAVYLKTAAKDAPVTIGYFNDPGKPAVPPPEANPGETRLYSVDNNGNLVTYLILKKVAGAGQMEIGGNVDNMVRYLPLDAGMQSAITAINTNFTTLATALGLTLPPVTLNISASKIDEIKTL